MVKPSKKLCGQFIAIKYDVAPERLRSIQLVRIDDYDYKLFHTKDSRKTDVLHSGINIIKVYGIIPETYKAWVRLLVKFTKEFYLPVPVDELCKTHGWISPEGKLYPCNDAGHWDLAGDILACVYGMDAYYPMLHDKGWIKIYRSGETSYSTDAVTQECYDTFVKLSELDGVFWKRNINRFLRNIKVEDDN